MLRSSACSNFPPDPDSLSRWLHSGSSNMAVIEVPMISGFRADVESLERVRNHINSHAHTFAKGLEIVHRPVRTQTHTHPLDIIVPRSGSAIARQAGRVVR